MCLRPQGFVALSVPDRERWQTSQDALESPTNHFLRRKSAFIVARAYFLAIPI